jgi:hypothetical protein
MTWADEVPLIEIIDQRYAAGRERAVGRDELWDRYFCDRMAGLPPKDWIICGSPVELGVSRAL